MAVHEDCYRRDKLLSVSSLCIFSLIASSSACSQNSKFEELPPDPRSEPALTAPEVQPIPPSPRLPEKRPKPRRETPKPVTVVKIESEGEGDDPSQDLVEVARRARADRRGRSSEMPIAVINNENLAEYANQGDLTYVEDEELVENPPAAEAEADTSVQEDYWRTQALESRIAWKETVERRQELEGRAAELRQRFYSEDDPFVRDGQVKPEWDRVLELLSDTRAEEIRHQADLEDLYYEAELAGADTAWVDEGIEYEPERPEEEDQGIRELPAHEVLEPPSSAESGP